MHRTRKVSFPVSPRGNGVSKYTYFNYPELHRKRFAEKIILEAKLISSSGTLSCEDEKTAFVRYNFDKYSLSKVVNEKGLPRSRRVADRFELLVSRVCRGEDYLFRNNYPLILAMAKRTEFPEGTDRDEAISYASERLLAGIKIFDFHRGFKFSTYGCRIILRAFSRDIRDEMRRKNRFRNDVGWDGSDDNAEFADEIVRRYRIKGKGEYLSPYELFELIKQASLSNVEKVVIAQRFPLDENERRRTLEQVGTELKITKERVRQIQMNALEKIRRTLEKQLD